MQVLNPIKKKTKADTADIEKYWKVNRIAIIFWTYVEKVHAPNLL